MVQTQLKAKIDNLEIDISITGESKDDCDRMASRLSFYLHNTAFVKEPKPCKGCGDAD